jgi:hypothetical protein
MPKEAVLAAIHSTVKTLEAACLTPLESPSAWLHIQASRASRGFAFPVTRTPRSHAVGGVRAPGGCLGGWIGGSKISGGRQQLKLEPTKKIVDMLLPTAGACPLALATLSKIQPLPVHVSLAAAGDDVPLTVRQAATFFGCQRPNGVPLGRA